jgi:hypothetical protein
MYLGLLDMSGLKKGLMSFQNVGIHLHPYLVSQNNIWTKQLWVRLTQQFFFSSSDVNATTCFDHFDHHQVADSGVLSQAVCLTVCRLMIIGWSKYVVALTSEEEKKNCCVRRTHNCFVNYTHATGSTTTLITMRDSHGNHDSWLLMQLTAIAVKQTACDNTPLSAAWWWSDDRNMLWH